MSKTKSAVEWKQRCLECGREIVHTTFLTDKGLVEREDITVIKYGDHPDLPKKREEWKEKEKHGEENKPRRKHKERSK